MAATKSKSTSKSSSSGSSGSSKSSSAKSSSSKSANATPDFAKQSKEQAQSDGLGDLRIQQGFMDQKSARRDDEAWEGHFVTVDLNNKDVKDAYKNTQGLEDHTGNYGVYVQTVAADEKTGRATVVMVRLRDETNALIRVPYDALTPADPKGR